MSEGMGSQELHVVVGGTGAIGGAVVEELVRRGHRVRSIGRREAPMPAGVEQRIADVMEPQQAIDAVAGASVVYQCAAPEYTRWVQEFPTLQANVADAAERAGAQAGRRREPLHVRPDRRTDVRDDAHGRDRQEGQPPGALEPRSPRAAPGRTAPRRDRSCVRLLRPERRELGGGGAVLRRGRPRQGPALDGPPGSAPRAVVPARTSRPGW